MTYSDKVFNLHAQIEVITDNRIRRPIKTQTVIRSSLIMALSRLGSLNALEQTAEHNKFWHRWIDNDLPSADTIGNISTTVDCNSIRKIIKHVYSQLKRNKALKPLSMGMFALVIDGHESSSSYLLHCKGCLKRIIHTYSGDKTQYYHRHVMAQLVCGNFYLPLDMEPQRPGEDEVAAAIRLLKRVLKDYPRAFNLILADGLYTRANFFKLALKHAKDVITVLKDERRDLLKDAQGLFKTENSHVYQDRKVKRECWDIEGFRSWDTLEREIRVVRSSETTYHKHHRQNKKEKKTSDWIWASTISQQLLPTEEFVELAHKRWAIENNGFNELVNYWHIDHVYRHDPIAIETFWLLTMLAYILFHAFINLNLKPQVRYRYTKLHLAQIITAELYFEISCIVMPP